MAVVCEFIGIVSLLILLSLICEWVCMRRCLATEGRASRGITKKAFLLHLTTVFQKWF